MVFEFELGAGVAGGDAGWLSGWQLDPSSVQPHSFLRQLLSPYHHECCELWPPFRSVLFLFSLILIPFSSNAIIFCLFYVSCFVLSFARRDVFARLQAVTHFLRQGAETDSYFRHQAALHDRMSGGFRAHHLLLLDRHCAKRSVSRTRLAGRQFVPSLRLHSCGQKQRLLWRADCVQWGAAAVGLLSGQQDEEPPHHLQ